MGKKDPSPIVQAFFVGKAGKGEFGRAICSFDFHCGEGFLAIAKEGRGCVYVVAEYAGFFSSSLSFILLYASQMISD